MTGGAITTSFVEIVTIRALSDASSFLQGLIG